MGTSFNALLKHEQIPSWRISLKSISIWSSHIHTGLLIEIFPSHFPMKNLIKITFTTCMPHSLPIFWLFSNTPVSDKYGILWKSTKCILFCRNSLSSVQTLFPSLRSQTQPAYKWQKALTILRRHFLYFSFNTSQNPYFNKQNELFKMQSNRSQNTFHITHQLQYISATRCHLHSSCFKRYKLPVKCNLTQDALYASPDNIPTVRILSHLFTQSRKYKWDCATGKACYGMVLLQQYWLELVNRCNWEFYRDFSFFMELRVTGTCSTCWKYDHLLLMNFLRMAPSCQNI